MLKELVSKPIASESRVAAVGSLILYVAGLLVFVLATLTLAKIDASRAQLIVGLLATISASLQLIVLGFLIDIRSRLKSPGAKAE